MVEDFELFVIGIVEKPEISYIEKTIVSQIFAIGLECERNYHDACKFIMIQAFNIKFIF